MTSATQVEMSLKGLRFAEIDRFYSLVSKMPERRRRFVFCYLAQEKPNGKQAAIDAGFASKSAEQEASRLLSDVKVRKAISIAQKRIEDKYLVTAERVVQELARIGFLDPRDAYNSDGTLKNMAEMPEDVARAVASVEKDELYEGSGNMRTWKGFTSKVKFWDKRGALELLGRKLGMFLDKHEVTGSLTLEELVTAAGGGEVGGGTKE
jgi:phage terminase small subunit